MVAVISVEVDSRFALKRVGRVKNGIESNFR